MLQRRRRPAGHRPPRGRSGSPCSAPTRRPSCASRLRVACRAMRIDVELYAAPYGQLEQEVLDPGQRALARFAPTHVLIAPTTADLDAARSRATTPRPLLDALSSRWRTLWQRVGSELGARVVQHAFVVPDETPLGHLALRLAGSRSIARPRAERAARRAPPGRRVLLVDGERIAGAASASSAGSTRGSGTRRASRTPHAALPLLARETAAVLAGDVGLAARCLVVDLDNTLWGGIVGEEGPRGDRRRRRARRRGVRRVPGLPRRARPARRAPRGRLEERPRGRARAVRARTRRCGSRSTTSPSFVADWRPKSEQLAEIAATLGSARRARLRRRQPGRVRRGRGGACRRRRRSARRPAVRARPRRSRRACASSCPSLTGEDLERAALVRRARRRPRSFARRRASLEDFWRSLEMRARVRAGRRRARSTAPRS